MTIVREAGPGDLPAVLGLHRELPWGPVDPAVLADTGRQGRPYLLVENVVVAAGHRRRGVARALLAEAGRRGRAAGCYELQLSAVDDEALAFYAAVGSQVSGRTCKRYLD